jgi:uncharacterized membrane protein YjjB (DUF3815 family)
MLPLEKLAKFAVTVTALPGKIPVAPGALAVR